MPHPAAAELFDSSNPRFTADRFTLLAQMRFEAPVTFLPALNVYAVTRWQSVFSYSNPNQEDFSGPL